MVRKLLIFGNGLGMAIDHEHFSLTNALTDVWENYDFLDDAEKELIERCLEHEGAPEGEHELDTLYQAVTHCSELSRIGDGDIHWLTEYGLDFPNITSIYLHKVATRLHEFDGNLPIGFENSVVDYVRETKSHVATLNYDKLLYQSLIENEILSGFDGTLVDGMLNRGFDEKALERRYGKDFGYYLHLHGSPLFYEHRGNVRKWQRHELDIYRDEASKHIVLTHVRRKPSVIASSKVLSTYWSYLSFALAEAEEIILFGYSGMDDHLNLMLRPYRAIKNIKVVEWSGAGNEGERERYWWRIFNGSVDLVRLDDITSFRDWG